jgi:hypothetical protein
MSHRFYRNTADIAVRGCPECGRSQASGVNYPADWVIVCQTCNRRGPAQDATNHSDIRKSHEREPVSPLRQCAEGAQV